MAERMILYDGSVKVYKVEDKTTVQDPHYVLVAGCEMFVDHSLLSLFGQVSDYFVAREKATRKIIEDCDRAMKRASEASDSEQTLATMGMGQAERRL